MPRGKGGWEPTLRISSKSSKCPELPWSKSSKSGVLGCQAPPVSSQSPPNPIKEGLSPFPAQKASGVSECTHLLCAAFSPSGHRGPCLLSEKKLPTLTAPPKRTAPPASALRMSGTCHLSTPPLGHPLTIDSCSRTLHSSLPPLHGQLFSLLLAPRYTCAIISLS